MNRSTKSLIAQLLIVLISITLPLIVFANPATTEERAALERQLQELEGQIDGYEATIQEYKKQGKSLQGEIKKLNAKVEKINAQIKAVTLEIAKLDDEINETQEQIAETEKKIDFNRQALVSALQTLYENENISLVQLLLENPELSDFFSILNNLVAVQGQLNDALTKMKALRQELVVEKEQLAEKRGDAEKLRRHQTAQKKDVGIVKDEKSQLLKTTKGQESHYQDLLKETQKSAAEIRKRIFQFLGGGELTFEEAYKLAKLTERAVGVRAALILAVLDKESLLGQNVGRCKYQGAMHPTRDLPLFLEIARELNLNPETLTVSCPNRDGYYGGAMGPAQFIPNTWNLYKSRVAELTGNRPPSPWRNDDAFMATALYLLDSGADMGGENGDRLRREKIAAAKYYAGKRWQRFLSSYGARVISKAQQFEQDIQVLGG